MSNRLYIVPSFWMQLIIHKLCDIMKNGDNFLPSHYMFTMYVLPIKFPVWHWKSMQFQVKKPEKSVTFHIPTLLFILYIICLCHLCISRVRKKICVLLNVLCVLLSVQHLASKGNYIIHNYNIINLPISWLCYASWIGIE